MQADGTFFGATADQQGARRGQGEGLTLVRAADHLEPVGHDQSPSRSPGKDGKLTRGSKLFSERRRPGSVTGSPPPRRLMPGQASGCWTVGRISNPSDCPDGLEIRPTIK